VAQVFAKASVLPEAHPKHFPNTHLQFKPGQLRAAPNMHQAVVPYGRICQRQRAQRWQLKQHRQLVACTAQHSTA
jgi:hypothetical protein